MNAVILDGAALTHETLAEAFGFPTYYGRNLDALADCLSELPPTAAIVLHGADADEYGRRILAVLRDAAQSNPNFRLFFGEEIL